MKPSVAPASPATKQTAHLTSIPTTAPATLHDALVRNVCTYIVTGRSYQTQVWYYCNTCNLNNNKGCCASCAKGACLPILPLAVADSSLFKFVMLAMTLSSRRRQGFIGAQYLRDCYPCVIAQLARTVIVTVVMAHAILLARRHGYHHLQVQYVTLNYLR